MTLQATVPNRKPVPLDWVLFVTTLALLSVGVVMVFNASYPLAIEMYHDKAFFVKKQALWAVIGLFGMFWMARVPFWKLGRWAVPLLLVAIFLLVAVMLIGHGAQGGQRWIGYKAVRIQPSEFAKLALVLFLARVLAARPWMVKRFWTGVLPLLGATVGVAILVERQPDLGTAIVIVLTALLMLWAGGVRTRWIVALLLVCTVAGTVLALHKGTDGYRWKRITSFLHPEADAQGAGYQIRHSKIALGTGGWVGVGLGESREKRRGNLPAQRTDFIFAIVGEEFGLLGTGGLILLFLTLAARGLHIAQRSRSPFGALLAVGITGMITSEAVINIGVVTASIPATGIPLPFLSYGGSSLVPTLLSIGILLNISQNPLYCEPKPTRRKRRPQPGIKPAEGALKATLEAVRRDQKELESADNMSESGEETV